MLELKRQNTWFQQRTDNIANAPITDCYFRSNSTKTSEEESKSDEEDQQFLLWIEEQERQQQEELERQEMQAIANKKEADKQKELQRKKELKRLYDEKLEAAK